MEPSRYSYMYIVFCTVLRSYSSFSTRELARRDEEYDNPRTLGTDQPCLCPAASSDALYGYGYETGSKSSNYCQITKFILLVSSPTALAGLTRVLNLE